MTNKTKVGVIYGGQSFEHEVSKMTAKSILENIDRNKFEVSEIYVGQDGNFDQSLLDKVDVAFLAVHGPNCEDGELQSLLEGRGVKYTGAGVEASRLHMDKAAQHDAFGRIGLPIVKYISARKNDDTDIIGAKINAIFGYPCFVKPNNGGSSVGISKVGGRSGLRNALDAAFEHDDRIVIEGAVSHPREIELAVIGNDKLTISEPGEVLSNGEFYSYDTKYFHPFSTASVAELSREQAEGFKSMAEKAYRATGCKGYARVDFFLDGKGDMYINEINTLPGFTKISMFPAMMQAAGIPYKELITRIIELALE